MSPASGIPIELRDVDLNSGSVPSWSFDIETINISGLRSYHLSSKAKTHISSRIVVKTKWEKVCKTPFQCLIVYATCSIHDSVIMIEAYLSRDVRHLIKNQISFYGMLAIPFIFCVWDTVYFCFVDEKIKMLWYNLIIIRIIIIRSSTKGPWFSRNVLGSVWMLYSVLLPSRSWHYY